MELNTILIYTIYLLALALFILVIALLFNINFIKQKSTEAHIALEQNLALEIGKMNINKEKLSLAEDLNKTLINRFFKITRDIVLLQKLIFDTYSK